MQRFIILVCAALCLAICRDLFLLPSGAPEVHLLNVGQGDATLIRTPAGATILIDGGPDLSVLSELPKHLPRLHDTIDLVVLSHGDADHVTGLPEVLRRHTVSHLLLSGDDHTSGRYKELLAIAADQEVSVLIAAPNTDIVFSDGTVLDIVWPPTGGVPNFSSNNNSVVLRVLWKDQSLLLTGDIEKEAEHAILTSGADIRSTILKVAHHGSKTSSSTGFLLASSPQLGLISSGKENRFGHPHQEVTGRFARLGIAIKNTADEGGISLLLE